MTTAEIDTLADAALIQLFQARRPGDDRAFTALFRRHHLGVWRLCNRFVFNIRDAEDLVQEVFLRVYRGLDQFEGRSSFTTWLYRVALSTGQNEIRSRNRRPKADDMEIDDLADRLTDGSTPEGAMLSAVAAESLARALESLPPESLEVLCLRDVEGLAYTELAERLSIGVSAAKMRVQRARQALQRAYQGTHRPTGPAPADPAHGLHHLAGLSLDLPGSVL
ncbi:MAG: sigma-70 family RNA polymerase sigma factor [Ardenticatenia bacterium]|nr:sigma-70 family RNA polymerase sigma factor [Ardenticatenia bacterium]